MNARLRRITADYEEIKKNFDMHKNIIVEPIGTEPAEKYKITYYINGIYLNGEGKIETLNKHIVTITLHSEYPRYKPICNIETPIWHPNFKDGQICIGDIWGAGESLSDIIINIGDMIQYKSWNSFSPLSADAAKWAIENKHIFPVSNIDLWTGEEVSGDTSSSFDIDIFEEESSEEEVKDDDSNEILKTDENEVDEENIGIQMNSVEVNQELQEKPINLVKQSIEENINDESDLVGEENSVYEEKSMYEENSPYEENLTVEENKLNEENIENEEKKLVKENIDSEEHIEDKKDLEEEEILSNENSLSEEEQQVNENILNQVNENTFNVDKYETTVAVLEDNGENDFNITAEELDGIEFVPAAARMQGNQYGTVQKNEKINFKTVFFKGILYGLIGGIVAWIVHELISVEPETILKWGGHSVSSLMSDVSSGKMTRSEYYSLIGEATLLSSAISSAIIGGFIGAVMGVGEGLYYGSKRNAIKYGFIGLGVAVLIGFIGGIMAQLLYSGLLSDATQYTSKIYLGFVRAIGWAVMGAGVGIATGLIKPEKMRIINCLLGGIAGGFIGGFLFNFIASSIGSSSTDPGRIPRAIGISIMGTLIGLGIGVLEQFAKAAWLKVVRGEFEGKEYLVFQGITSIGNSGKNTIVLFKDKLVAPNHCEIIQQGRSYILIDKGSPGGTSVNGMRIGKHSLRQGDAISIGNSILVFNTK